MRTSKHLHYSLILVRNRSKQGNREATHRLRRAMLEVGMPYCCRLCECQPEWQGTRLDLEIDHYDGDFLNNEIENLRFLCPNCHSQTPNFRAKNHNRLTETDIDEMYAWTGSEEIEE